MWNDLDELHITYIAEGGWCLPLTCLAPDFVEAILDGRQPKGLRLAEVLGHGPLAWEEQRGVWGFSSAGQ